MLVRDVRAEDTDELRRLSRLADTALKSAASIGLIGPDIEQLTDWAAAARIELRRRQARARVADALAAITVGGAG